MLKNLHNGLLFSLFTVTVLQFNLHALLTLILFIALFYTSFMCSRTLDDSTVLRKWGSGFLLSSEDTPHRRIHSFWTNFLFQNLILGWTGLMITPHTKTNNFLSAFLQPLCLPGMSTSPSMPSLLRCSYLPQMPYPS
jgi:hypothetical protein